MILAPGVQVPSRPRGGRARLLGWAVLAAVAALAGPAGAQAPGPSAADKETARSLMDRGDERFWAKDYAPALQAFVAAHAIMRLPQTGFAVARAQIALGLLLEGRDTALQVRDLPATPGESPIAARARADAGVLADEVAPRIPSIQVVVGGAPADLIVSVDGAALPPAAASAPRKVNPGAHVVTATATGYKAASIEVTVTEGALVPVKLELAPLPSPGGVLPPHDGAPAGVPRRRVSVLVPIGFAVGGAGLVVGAGAGAATLSLGTKLKAECNAAGGCPPRTHDDLRRAQALANVADAALVLGAAGVGLGVVGVIRSLGRPDTEAPRGRVDPVVGPGFVGLQGTF